MINLNRFEKLSKELLSINKYESITPKDYDYLYDALRYVLLYTNKPKQTFYIKIKQSIINFFNKCIFLNTYDRLIFNFNEFGKYFTFHISFNKRLNNNASFIFVRLFFRIGNEYITILFVDKWKLNRL